jgi:hypothetical protein
MTAWGVVAIIAIGPEYLSGFNQARHLVSREIHKQIRHHPSMHAVIAL